MESRRVRMLSRTDSAVALALVQRQAEDAAAARAALLGASLELRGASSALRRVACRDASPWCLT